MANVLDYQPAPNKPHLRIASIVYWTGAAFTVLGGLVMLIATLANLQYINRYPALDVLCFALGVMAAPAIGTVCLLCTPSIKKGRPAASVVAAVMMIMTALLCICVAIGAAIEAAECAARGTYIDAAITASVGTCGTLLIALAATWLTYHLLRLARTR